MTINSDNSLGMKILEMLDKSVYMDVITGKLQSISPALTRIDLAKSTIRKLHKIGYGYQAANYAANEYRRGIFNEKAWAAITTWLEGK